MANIENHTGVPHFWFEQTGPEGERLDVLVVRATFDFAAGGELMTLAREQHPVVLGDTFSGPVATDPLRAVVKEDGDLLPYKPGTDILVTGHANAPEGRAHINWVAGIRVGKVQKILRLHGPRQFRKQFFGWRLGLTEPTTHVALDYRLAFGGCIDIPAALTSDGEQDTVKHSGNPAGCGWLPKPAAYGKLDKAARKHVAKWVRDQKVIAAPQIEDALEPVVHPCQTAATDGLGPIARWWTPRQALQGTYDEKWRNDRYPMVPEDFDSRFYQSAHPDLVAVPHLTGDESVTLSGLLPQKRDMRLPGWRLVAVVTRASGDSMVSLPVLDTVRFDLDRCQASLVWRAHYAEAGDPVIELMVAATTAAIECDQSLSIELSAPGENT
ncbi:DUF2169 family type VI secretion system accessory protein [Massilia sp. TWR1-2-2]|uniref:DUF2169 family type VI secretion system accessory protein n=1 Tax=Massilia sp. TWR1-2-2 TaxID=2804584 RepID=UPI003CEAF730